MESERERSDRETEREESVEDRGRKEPSLHRQDQRIRGLDTWGSSGCVKLQRAAPAGGLQW